MISSTSGDLEVAVPDAVGVDDEDRTLVVLLVAAHPGGAHPGQLEALHLVAQPLEDVLRSLAAAVVAADGRADEDVQVARAPDRSITSMVAHRARLRPGPRAKVSRRWT